MRRTRLGTEVRPDYFLIVYRDDGTVEPNLTEKLGIGNGDGMEGFPFFSTTKIQGSSGGGVEYIGYGAGEYAEQS